MEKLFFDEPLKQKTILWGKLTVLFLFFSCVAYGQDLIVTTTGDSILNCKIIEVKTGVIQFRFGNGNPIDIKRTEVSSYKYNYVTKTPVGSTSGSKTQSRAGKTRAVQETSVATQPVKEGYPPIYLRLVLGGQGYGSFAVVNNNRNDVKGEINEIVGMVGLDAAYFFNQSIGAGFKVNYGGSEVAIGGAMSFYDEVIFWGPSFYGRWGKGKIGFTVNAGLGGLSWNMTDIIIWHAPYKDFSTTSFGGFLSAGVNIMFTKHFGISANIQSVIGSVKGTFEETGEVLKRNPTSIGGTLGLDFRF
jgi:hypothetical protein